MKIIASWDDGTTADLKMAELMVKYDIPTIFYWPENIKESKNLAFSSSWLNEKDCREISSSFEIGSHSKTQNPMKKMTIQQIVNEISGSREHWQNFTGQEINSFAYPKNSITSLTKALVKGAGYKTARTSITGFLTAGEDPYAVNCTVQIGINRIEYNNKSWQLFADEMIEKSNEESIFHIFGNPWDIESYYDWDNFENLLKILTGR